MQNNTKEERWLSGPIPNISPILQPAAHALLQSKDELAVYLKDFPNALLWEQPSGRASVGFHAQHITGVLDRMLTYSLRYGNLLSEEQYQYLKVEGIKNEAITVEQLVYNFNKKVEEALDYFKNIDESVLLEARTVGRKKLPSTVLGLLFHAAEHSQRHIGQLLVTVSVLLKK